MRSWRLIETEEKEKERERERNSKEIELRSELTSYIFTVCWHLASHYNYFIHTRPGCYLLHT